MLRGPDGTTMMSAGNLISSRPARAIAVLAVLVFGWQGAAQGLATASLHTAIVGQPHTIVSRAEAEPAQTIRPAAPVEIAKPAPPERRPLVASAAAALSAEAFAALPTPADDTACDAARRPATLLCPPHTARGPPLS